jgi:hypothetical protein
VDWISFTEQRFGITLKRASRSEYCGPCPWCGGRDRFRVWEQGNFWCRPGPGHCARSGWLDELDGVRQMTRDELVELRLAALERAREEDDRRISVLERMHQSEDHLRYHDLLCQTEQAVDYWLHEGMSYQTINDRKLGFCLSCPMMPGYASYTIPVISGGKLYNIRHRIANPPDGGKYRPHMAGLPAMIFNADDLLRYDEGRILILEGEKKSMVVSQETGLPNIATMGKQSFKAGWAGKLAKFQQVYVCYDPDAKEQAYQTARLFNGRGHVMHLHVKADDFFTRWGGNADGFNDYIKTARPV